MCERYQISDRADAAIGSATLKDFGVVTEYDASLVIDRSKLRRERQKYRMKLEKQKKAYLKLLMEYISMDEKISHWW